MADALSIRALLRHWWIALGLVLVFVITLGLLAGARSGLPIEAKVLRIEPAQIFDDAGAEMSLVTVILTCPTNTTWFFTRSRGTTAEARIAGKWLQIYDPIAPWLSEAIRPNETLVVVPAGTEKCRIRLCYATSSFRWHIAAWAMRHHVKLAQSFWRNWGYSRAGAHPHWKTTTIEFPLSSGS